MPDDLPAVSNSFSGMSGQVAQIGVVRGDVHLTGTSRPASLPLRVGLVPSRAASFQERVVPVSERVVLSGLGGVGKTQLAADYAERLWAAGEIRLLVWVTATSRDAIVSSYADAATKLTGVKQDWRAFLEWLGMTSEPWLVVLDDLQTPSDLSGLWPPASGRVIVTTRRRDASLRGDRLLVGLNVFSSSEACTYLSSLVGADDDIAVLADELGCLPLALAQAGAYMLDRHLSCTDYLVRLSERRLALLAPDALPDENRAAVAATWSLSVEHANWLTPQGVARPLLDIASALDANGIPLDLFMSPAVLEFLGVDESDAHDGLSCLHRLSLITLDTDAREVRVHALVQRATRDAWADAETVVRTAADGLLQMCSIIEATVEQEQALQSNVDALFAVGDRWLCQEDLHPLMLFWGISLGLNSLKEVAERFFEELSQAAAERHGPDHVNTLTARRMLIESQYDKTDPASAAIAHQQLLKDQLRVLGTHHAETLLTRRSLAMCQGKVNSPVTAAIALRDVLDDQMRVLGPDHPEVLTTGGNIAFMLVKAGDLPGAITEAERLLEDSLRIVGPDDSYTLATRQNLADLRGQSGDLNAAITENRRVLADRIRISGTLHGDTWASRANLVRWLREAGDVSEAAAECKRLLKDQVRVLGADHPEVQQTREAFLYLSERSASGRPTPL